MIQDITTKYDEWKEERAKEKEEQRLKEEEEKRKEEENADSSSLTINNTVSEIQDKFGFVDNIKTNVNDMVNVITDTTSAPKFEMNVNSKWYSGTVTIIDFSFYDDYRELGDTVICIFCYLGFLWNIFMKLPDIIHGAGASSYATDMFNDIRAYNKTGFGRSSSIRRRGF